jgi:predicted nucleic acid-binding protein
VIWDTNGLSALVEGEPTIEPLLRKADHLAIPVIVLAECRYGIWRSGKRRRYQQWLQEHLRKFRILDIEDGPCERLGLRAVPSSEAR